MTQHSVEIEKDMDEKVALYLSGRKEHGRYLSFEHCYCFFQKNYSESNKQVKEHMALHLFAYLASWGMLRNSFLMYKDYTYLVGLIEILSKKKEDSYNPFEIMEIKKAIISYFKGPEDNPTTYITNRSENQLVNKRKNWDTLTSKIILGTLGCVPAYDDYFKGVAKKVFGIRNGFNETGLRALQQFQNVYSSKIKELQTFTKNDCGFEYPEMKIIDMYFWQKGYSEKISIN